jgi:hypothetical protein
LATAGAVISILVGLFVEREFSSALSTTIFLGLFFANFWISWVLTIWLVERYLRIDSVQCDQCEARGIDSNNFQCPICKGAGWVKPEPKQVAMAAAE